MSKGKGISVSMPDPLVKDLDEAAKKVGISRSRFICNLLLQWQDHRNNPVPVATLEQTSFETKPNNCPNRDDDGFCSNFDQICNAPQREAIGCVGYPKPENMGK